MTQTRLSADGRFRWHEDLGVWEPIAPVPVGVKTPDGRYWWDGVRWRVNLVAAEGWSRVAQDEAERERREAEGRLPQRRPQPPNEEMLCPDCKRGTIRRHGRCDNCGLSWYDLEAQDFIEPSALRQAATAISAAFLVLAGIVIVGFLIVLASYPGPNSK